MALHGNAIAIQFSWPVNSALFDLDGLRPPATRHSTQRQPLGSPQHLAGRPLTSKPGEYKPGPIASRSSISLRFPSLFSLHFSFFVSCFLLSFLALTTPQCAPFPLPPSSSASLLCSLRKFKQRQQTKHIQPHSLSRSRRSPSLHPPPTLSASSQP